MLEDSFIEFEPFPASSKQASGIVNGIKTEVTSVYFLDKILFTICQGRGLAQWIEVPLSSSEILSSLKESSNHFNEPRDGAEMILPLSYLTPRTLMGGSGEQRETISHLYAVQIANSIAKKNPDDSRIVLVGIGLEKLDPQRETFFDMMELLQMVI